MDIRAQLEERLTEYVQNTLIYIQTIRDFCDQEQKWTSERKAELEKMSDINEKQQEEKELGAVLKHTLEGLKKLEPFLDAMEKLTVTSSHVFSGQIFLLCGESPERVQTVISDARIDARLLILFRRDAESFFQPRLDNVNILVFQLRNYILQTEQLCSRVRQTSVLCGDIYECKTGQPLVRLILNVSEGTMHQMLDHLNQLCEIRRNEHTRLAFLFQENAQKFIDVFSERRSRMWQLLTDLEETAVKLDSMKKKASIFTVVGSSVGIAGGFLSIAGIALAPLTAGASLVCTLAGVVGGGISAANNIATDIAETKVNYDRESDAQSYLKSYNDDMIKIEDCLNEAVNCERPLVQPSADYKWIVAHSTVEGMKETSNVMNAVTDYKDEKVRLTNAKLSEIATENSNTASDTRVVRRFRTRSILKITNISKIVSCITNILCIGLDSYLIDKERKSLAKGSESEVSKLIRSRAALWRSELEAWEKMNDSLCIGIKTINETQDALKKPFLP